MGFIANEIEAKLEPILRRRESHKNEVRVETKVAEDEVEDLREYTKTHKSEYLSSSKEE